MNYAELGLIINHSATGVQYATVVSFENGTLDSSDAIYLVDSVIDDLNVQFSSTLSSSTIKMS